MTKTIWKYPLTIKDEYEIDIPSPAIPLAFQTQRGEPTLWCLVDPEMGLVKKRFRLAGTGHIINNSMEELKYIGTAQLMKGMLVYHLFELLS